MVLMPHHEDFFSQTQTEAAIICGTNEWQLIKQVGDAHNLSWGPWIEWKYWYLIAELHTEQWEWNHLKQGIHLLFPTLLCLLLGWSC